MHRFNMEMEKDRIQKNGAYYRRRLSYLLDSVDLRGHEVLDLGCGEMWLYKEKAPVLKSYFGIDRFSFSEQGHAITGDILDRSHINERSFDSIFLLGVLDHLDEREKREVLKAYHPAFRKHFIVSQCNRSSPLHQLLGWCKGEIDLHPYFEDCHCAELLLFKIPCTQVLFNVSALPGLFRMWATERVSVFTRKSV